MKEHYYTMPARVGPTGSPRSEEEQMDQEADRRAEEESTDTDAALRGDRRSEQRAPERPDQPAGTQADRTDDREPDRTDDRGADRTGNRDRNDGRDVGPDDREREREPDDEEPGERAEYQMEQPSEEADSLLQELVAYLREGRTKLREEWARRISEAQLLGVMSDEEIFSEATEVYDNYVDALETGSIETLRSYARELSERIIPRGVETHEVLGIVLLLRDVLARSLFAKYQNDLDVLNRILDAYEPAANRIAVTVGVSFVEERERVIHEQQEAMRELSTPVLQLKEHLLILPIIGALDSARARQLTEQLLGAIQEHRAKVVVIDITGVATIDGTVANHLVQTVEASRLMGASTILTGLSSEIAQTLVDLGVDLSMMKTVGDLQGGLEEAERLAGYWGGDPAPPDDR
jgi:rsbT co-antagonist protein RsbR